MARHLTPRRALAATALVLSVIAGAWLLGIVPQKWLGHQWCRQLNDASPDEIAGILNEIAADEMRGLPMLVEGIGHNRAVVSLSARRILLAELARWRFLPDQEAARRIERLTFILVEKAPQFDKDRQRFAAALASRILLYPVDRRWIDSEKLTAQCEEIFRIAPAENRSSHRVKKIARRDSLGRNEGTVDQPLADLPAQLTTPRTLPPRDISKGLRARRNKVRQ